MQEIMADNEHIAVLREHQDGQRVELWHLESGLSQQDPSGPGCMARGMGSGTGTWCHTQHCPKLPSQLHTLQLYQSHFIRALSLGKTCN